MSEDEYLEVGEYLKGLWPKMFLTPEQAALWKYRLLRSSAFDVREAIGEFAVSSKFSPKLSELLAALKRVKQKHAGTTAIPGPDISAEHIEQCRKDDEDEDWELSNWTAEDREMAKTDILNHEPELQAAFGPLKSAGKTWRHLIISRCVEKKVTLYPPGIAPIQMHVDEWWAMPHKVGAMADSLAMKAAPR